jgi:sec-independent protein translocase protein TatA
MFPSLGPGEMMAVMIVAVLLFGKRLPEVGRSLGKGIIEFKKGLRGIEDDLDLASQESRYSSHSGSSYSSSSYSSSTSSDQATPSVPKFEPPTSAPIPQSEYAPQPYQD